MALDLSRRRRKHLLLIAGAGLSLYGAYKLYHLPSISRKQRRLVNLLKTLLAVADAVSSSAETVSLLSADLNLFLRSTSDDVPNSLRQFSKLARSGNLSGSVSWVSEALAVGVVKGLKSSGSGSDPESPSKMFDKLFSPAGSGFASVVVGSFARNLVLAFYSSGGQKDESESPSETTENPNAPSSSWLDFIHDDDNRDLIAECIQIFVSNAVAVYLEKTMNVNTYDEFFTGLTNPRHEVKVKDLVVSVCNGAVETFVKTSHLVLTSYHSDEQALLHKGSSEERIKEIGKWVNQVSSTLAVPTNRRLVLDVTGRVTCETVKSFLDFVMWKVYTGVKWGANVMHEEVLERGLALVKYVGLKSMLIAALCVILCMRVLADKETLETSSSENMVFLQ